MRSAPQKLCSGEHWEGTEGSSHSDVKSLKLTEAIEIPPESLTFTEMFHMADDDLQIISISFFFKVQFSLTG